VSRLRPSEPPILPGFSYIRMLGSGGFADVYLYEQNMPRRAVAVKVMLPDVVTESVRRMFQIEANLMGQLSSHPSILTVYQASISADGRPYLVMELCAAQLAQRYRRERLSVAEVLQIGVQVGAAIQAAHHAGVLHRDIKPSNILTTAYGHPVLSDFGIAATVSAGPSRDTIGMSVPWSAPEVLLERTPGTVESEVWSLGATLWSLLAGRSPFEIAGETSTADQLTARITRGKLPALDRLDVPDALKSVLRRTMSRDPGSRQRSVIELVRDLQRVEIELGLVPTRADVAADDWALATVSDPEDRTIVRSVAPAVTSPRVDGRRRRSLAAQAGTDSPQQTPAPAGRTPRSRLLAMALGAAAILVTGLGAALAISTLQADPTIPTVTGVRAETADARVVFRWDDPGLLQDDAFQVQVTGAAPALQRSTEFAVVAPPGEEICLTVRVVRGGRLGSETAERCAEAGE
jgi:eukaryotic-like serine/threonine-protein kinase